MDSVIVSDTPLSPGELLSAFTDHLGDAGGIVSFSGQVRSEGCAVSTLTLQAYEPMTSHEILNEVNKVRDKFNLSAVCVRHRVGEMQPGETIVFCATAATHRRAAFEACDYLMDYLKTRAVFWKLEDGPSGRKWIEPREQDYQDAKRWSRS